MDGMVSTNFIVGHAFIFARVLLVKKCIINYFSKRSKIKMREVILLLSILVSLKSISILLWSWIRVWINLKHLLFFTLLVSFFTLRFFLLLNNFLSLFISFIRNSLVLILISLSRIEVNMRSIHVQRRFRHSCIAKSGLAFIKQLFLWFLNKFYWVLRMVAVLGNSAGFRNISLCRALLTLGLLHVHYKLQSALLNCD